MRRRRASSASATAVPSAMDLVAATPAPHLVLVAASEAFREQLVKSGWARPGAAAAGAPPPPLQTTCGHLMQAAVRETGVWGRA